MKKTKTQAQKQAERDERIKARKAGQEAIKAVHTVQIQKSLQEQSNESDESKSLDKKTLRKQKKDAKNKWSLLPIKSSTIINSISETTTDSTSAHSSGSLVEQRTQEQAINDVKLEMSVTPTKDDAVTVVINHSTFCEGLMPVIARLQKMNLSKCTIIPGEISQGQSHTEQFELRFQRMENANTYKFVARNGYTIQDVSIVVSNAAIFTQEVVCDAVKQAIENKAEKSDPKTKDSYISYSNYNRITAYGRETFWRQASEEEAKQRKAKESERKRQEKIHKQSKKLAPKGIAPDLIQNYAERDVDIITGKNRTRNSM